MDTIREVIIIGSGPAGHTAALYCARADMHPLMFEGFQAGGIPGGQLMTTTDVENYPGFPQGISGAELMIACREQSLRFGNEIMTQDVTSVDMSKRPFKVTSDGQTYLAHSVIICTGASARYIGLKNEQRLLNNGVSACATCDGALPMFRNQPLVVVGGGDTAMEEATFLSRFASKIYLVHRRSGFRSSEVMLKRVKKNEKIEILTPWVIDDVLGDDYVTGVKIKNRDHGDIKEIKCAGLFVAIGHTPNTAVFNNQIKLDSNGYILTGAGNDGNTTHTSIPGIFAAGDVQDHRYRQAVTAAGSGCAAALDCKKWLEDQAEQTTL